MSHGWPGFEERARAQPEPRRAAGETDGGIPIRMPGPIPPVVAGVMPVLAPHV